MKTVKKIVLRTVLIVVLGVLAVVAYQVAKIGPRNVIGILRYDQSREGSLQVGDRAPEVTVSGLDGTPRPLLSTAGSGTRPTVLIFGSYT